MNPVVICSVPYVDTVEPIMAPAVLKSALASAGIESVAIDLNIEIVNMIADHPHKQKILDFFFSQLIYPEVIDDITNIIDYCANRIVESRPPLVGLSLLVYSCQIFTRWLCAAIRQKHQCQIVIGGTGIKNFIADSNENFCQQMKTLGLIDDFISGDGEISLAQYCQGNLSYPGINSWQWQPIPNLNELPYPDYSDYDFDQYQKKVMPLCDSRGCVRNCEFCDVIEYWTKFQYRSADSVFSEMLYQVERFNIRQFDFRSSLSNGNLREFKRLIDLMASYNQNKAVDQQLGWAGYFIVRPASQHPEALWEKMKLSNGSLFLGIESVLPHVRNRMGKPFSNDDIDYHLDMAQKYKVPLLLLMITGYPTETLDDYEFTKQWFRDRRRYAGNGVTKVLLSFASILPNTQLSRNSQDLKIVKGKLPSIWIRPESNISIAHRKQYLLDLQKICEECGFDTQTNHETLEHTTDELY